VGNATLRISIYVCFGRQCSSNQQTNKPRSLAKNQTDRRPGLYRQKTLASLRESDLQELAQLRRRFELVDGFGFL
jgi:hypothetical protein